MNKYYLALFLFLYALTAIANDYSNAWINYNSGKYEQAMQSFNKLAKEGNVYSQAIVSVQHAAENRYIEDKEPSPYSPNDVISKITAMYNSGDIEATFLLALMFDEGWATSKDDVVSKKLYLIASETGHTAAQTHLAEYYELGVAGEKDKKKAIYWYKKVTRQRGETRNA